MNPFRVLNMEPTDNKMLIRRAYVKMAKEHHPDNGGDIIDFLTIKDAYELLISGKYKPANIEANVELAHKELLTGCIASAIIVVNKKPILVEFEVPAMTFPGTTISFVDEQIKEKISITIQAEANSGYNILNQHVLIQREINMFDALTGVTLEIENFDGWSHTIDIPPNTSAKKLIYEIEGHGFFDKKTKQRGKLSVLVTIKKKVY